MSLKICKKYKNLAKRSRKTFRSPAVVIFLPVGFINYGARLTYSGVILQRSNKKTNPNDVRWSG